MRVNENVAGMGGGKKKGLRRVWARTEAGRPIYAYRVYYYKRFPGKFVLWNVL